jgi:hemerythrin-like domain-containing protein
MKSTDLLIQDHKIILRSFNVLEQLAACVTRNEELVEADVVTLLRFLREFADKHHQAKEECVLFPELRRTANAQDGALREMLFEHDQERSLVEGLEESLYTKKGIDFVYYADRLTSIIRNHIRKEDDILFDIADRSLSTEQDEAIVAAFNRFEVNPSFLADLRRLEWKYLSKVA